MSSVPSVGLCVCVRACMCVVYCGKMGYWIWMPFGMGPMMRQVDKGGDCLKGRGNLGVGGVV